MQPQKRGRVAQLDTCLPAGREHQGLKFIKKMHFVYVIRSLKDGRFYVGITADVSRRLEEHNRGKTFSTKAYKPWLLVFTETYSNRLKAREREKFLKGGSGKEYIKIYWSRSSVG